MQRLASIVIVLYVLSQAFDSVLRWLLNLAHVAALIYVRDVGLIVLTIGGIGSLVSQRKDITLSYWLLCLLSACTCVSIISGLALPQVLFGLKVWLPFAAGVLIVDMGVIHRLKVSRATVVVWAALCAGVFVNHFYRFPWVGLDIQLGDASVSANREWSAAGVDRLSGFSRSSYDAATAILLLYVFLVMRYTALAPRLAFIVISGLAIALTTTKGILLALVSSLILLPIFTYVRSTNTIVQKGLVAALLFVATTGLVVPLVSLELPIPVLREGTTEYWLFASFVDRAWNTWPQALSLVSGWQTAFGRGIGGIGVAQDNFEAGAFNPGDNLFVYLYVTAGVLGLFFYALCAQSVRYLSLRNVGHQTVFLIWFCVFVYGVTSNIVENATLALVMGALVGYMLSLRKSAGSASGVFAAADSAAVADQ